MNENISPKKRFGSVKSRIIINTLIIILSFGISVGLIELFSGGLFTHKIIGLHDRIVSYHNLLTGLRWPIGSYRYHETIGYEQTPAFSGKLLNNSFYYKTHELGYRIPEFADNRSYESGGVISLGCSFTFGDGVEAEETFSFLFADRLNKQAYNYGVCSYSYTSSLLQLEDLHKKGTLEKLKPSIVILGAGGWMIERSLSPFYPTGGLQFAYAYIGNKDGQLTILQPKKIYSRKHLYDLVEGYFDGDTRQVPLTFNRYLRLLSVLPRILKSDFDKIRFKPDDISSRRLYDFVIKRIITLLGEYSPKLMILWMPHDGRKMDTGLVESVNGFGDVLLVDGLKALEKKSIDPDLYYYRHPNRAIHAIYAEQLFRKLKEQN